MADFIQVHAKSTGKAFLINLNWVEEIIDYDEGPTIFLAFNIPDAVEQDYLETEESYEDIFNMIRRCGK